MKRKKVLAVASAGGHWVQLIRLSPAWSDCEICYVSTSPSYNADAPCDHYHGVREASMWSKLSLLIMALQIFSVFVRFRPDIVITTGAAPGFFAVVIGKIFRSKTIWIDSIANADELSLAGKKARKWAETWLTQWPHLAQPEGPYYLGAVL